MTLLNTDGLLELRSALILRSADCGTEQTVNNTPSASLGVQLPDKSADSTRARRPAPGTHLRGPRVSSRWARAAPPGPERAQARGAAPQHGSEGARKAGRDPGNRRLTHPSALLRSLGDRRAELDSEAAGSGGVAGREGREVPRPFRAKEAGACPACGCRLGPVGPGVCERRRQESASSLPSGPRRLRAASA